MADPPTASVLEQELRAARAAIARQLELLRPPTTPAGAYGGRPENGALIAQLEGQLREIDHAPG